jgi:hypothetical protein
MYMEQTDAESATAAEDEENAKRRLEIFDFSFSGVVPVCVLTSLCTVGYRTTS